MNDDSETAPLSWWAGPEGLVIYQDGEKVATLPAGCFPQLVSEMARVMATRGFGK